MMSFRLLRLCFVGNEDRSSEADHDDRDGGCGDGADDALL